MVLLHTHKVYIHSSTNVCSSVSVLVVCCYLVGVHGQHSLYMWGRGRTDGLSPGGTESYGMLNTQHKIHLISYQSNHSNIGNTFKHIQN